VQGLRIANERRSGKMLSFRGVVRTTPRLLRIMLQPWSRLFQQLLQYSLRELGVYEVLPPLYTLPHSMGREQVYTLREPMRTDEWEIDAAWHALQNGTGSRRKSNKLVVLGGVGGGDGNRQITNLATGPSLAVLWYNGKKS
jgi:hypothetical protein